MTHRGVNHLLCLLREMAGLDYLPRDRRTLCHTLRSVDVVEKCGGSYVYLGLQKGIEKSFITDGFVSEVKLFINVDGLPLFKSSKECIWPILGQFSRRDPFLIALFYGKAEPDDASDYLSDFLKELDVLSSEATPHFKGREYHVSIRAFICDAPARVFLRGTVKHNGYWGCERCESRGTWYKGREVFDECDNLVNRTHDKFATYDYMIYDDDQRCHQLRPCPLLSIQDFDIVGQFVLDSMHLVYLGAIKRILEFLLADSKSSRCRSSLTAAFREQLSDNLADLNGTLPSEFVRQPRSLEFFKFFKTTEFRSFLLYTGAVVLRDVLSHDQYVHFLKLSVACRLLCEPDDDIREGNLDLSRKLLKNFVKSSPRFYGRKFRVFNIHNLLHVADDVEYFGQSMTELSAFPFENYLQALKRFVRGTNNPLSEIIRRKDEFQSCKAHRVKQHRSFKVLPNGKDSAFQLDDGIVLVRRRSQKDTFVCDFFPWNELRNFYERPVPSEELGTFFLPSTVIASRILVDKSALTHKLVNMPCKDDGYAFMPLLHDLN